MDLKVEVPSHPTAFFFFYSAPSSPSRHLLSTTNTNTSPSSSSVPFTWESLPGLPKPITSIDEDFQFDFSGHLDRAPLSAADELFHAGQILPLKPPPRLHSPPSNSPISKLKHRPNPDFDPFQVALEHTRRQDFPHRRSRRKTSRSLSPLRVSEFALTQQQLQNQSNDVVSRPSSFRRWRLKDLLLFRSASEGRPSAKLSIHAGDEKNLGSSRRRSAHEMHHAGKKKTYVPYRFGFLGCLGFNPSGSRLQEISRGFGYSFGG